MSKLKSKIVFVNPPLTVKERYGITHQSGGTTQPLGLASLATVVRKEGYKTSIVDAEALHLNPHETANTILSREPDFVGFTAVTISIFNATMVAELIKKENSKILCLIGGHHFTSVPKETMERFPFFDVGVIGEGEITIVELLNALKEGASDLSSIDGLMFKKGNKWVFTSPRKRIRNLDSLPFPAWDLLPEISKYYRPPAHTVKKLPACGLVTSRGCPGKCIFCDRCVYGNVGTYFSAEYVMEMIKDLYYNYGIREIQFRDDNFLTFRKRLLKLCEFLIKENLPLSWTCLGRVDQVDPEILKAMHKAGCWQIWYGIESGAQRVLDIIKKGITIEQTKRAVGGTREAGIAPCGTFIIGSPGETVETIKQTVDFALKLNIEESHVSFMTPFPGSELYNKAIDFGIFENDWQKLNGWLPVFIPYGLTRENLESWSKKFFTRFYFRPRAVLNYFKKTKSLKNLKVYFAGFLALLEWIIKRRI